MQGVCVCVEGQEGGYVRSVGVCMGVLGGMSGGVGMCMCTQLHVCTSIHAHISIFQIYLSSLLDIINPLRYSLMCTHSHKHTHTCMHTRTHAHTHAHKFQGLHSFEKFTVANNGHPLNAQTIYL